MPGVVAKAVVAAACLAVACLSAPDQARADTMTWQLRSFHPNAVEVKFFSQNRRAIWPGADKHYTIKDYKVNSFKLNCIAGEQICYGAAVSGNLSRYWGQGVDGKKACTNCCYTCGGDTRTKVHNLNDR